MRWKLAIVTALVILTAAVLLGAVLVGFVDRSNPNPPNPCPPCGTASALSPATEQGHTGEWWYNFSVVSASGVTTLGELAFQVQTSTGSVISLANSTLTVLGPNGTVAGIYNVTSAHWTSGAATVFANNQLVVLRCSNDLRSKGDTLVVLGSGSFSESVSVNIP